MKKSPLTQNVEGDVLGNRVSHPIGSSALVHPSLVSVCLLNRDTGAFHSLLTRWQQVVLE
jgi:hypothetical protein